MTGVSGLVPAALLSAVLVGVVRVYAVRTDLLDVPSDRSSHRHPVPRGGGAGVVVAILVVLAWQLGGAGAMSMRLGTALAAVALVALVGWVDDHRSLGAASRLAVHVVAGVAVAWAVPGAPGPFGTAGAIAVAWWIAWAVSMVNVTNFMDGIDGLIGSQMAIFGLHLWIIAPGESAGGVTGSVLLGASLGFLAWNWAPARIFLGDAGSGSLGLVACLGGALAVQAGAAPVEIAFLPLFPIFLDASATLARRVRHGEPMWQAHREHLYQRLANGGWGHARTAAAYGFAALLGALVAQAGAFRSLAACAYAFLIVAIGWWLDRQYPRYPVVTDRT